jgi:outer membrane protein assembly factor BamB
MAHDAQRSLADLVFVSFNKQVVALDRYTGELVWKWSAPKGSGFIALLIDGDRLIASCQGYTYCLDPMFGQLVWSNPLEGMGVGIPCIASVNGTSANSIAIMSAAAAELAQQQQAAQGGAAAAAAT